MASNRQIFLTKSAERFRQQHAELVRRGAARFDSLPIRKKQAIVERARDLLGHQRLKLHTLAKQIAIEMDRSVETIRYTLRRFDQAHPDQALFVDGDRPVVSERHQRIWILAQAGDPPDQIAEAFGCDTAGVEQILREMELRELKAQPLTYIYSDEFVAPQADAMILGSEPPAQGEEKPVRPAKDLPPYLRSLYDVPLLGLELERDLFRRYNYLKFKATRLLETIDECQVSEEELFNASRLVEAANQIKNRLIEANLRLVVSIAKRHISGKAAHFFEVISDGNLSLMRAVDNFDYTRGTRFSTYASWAVMRNYARSIPQVLGRGRGLRQVTGQEELLEATADHRPVDLTTQRREGMRQALAAGLLELSERERTVVAAHFGLQGQQTPSTLEQLGDRFGVTKERVRQIEKRALNKLRTVLSPAVQDLLVEP